MLALILLEISATIEYLMSLWLKKLHCYGMILGCRLCSFLVSSKKVNTVVTQSSTFRAYESNVEEKAKYLDYELASF